MPFPSCYDPVADAAGSADPLGTLGGSERLAEVILPGLTARMWRARLLTFTVVAADIADAVVRDGDEQEDIRLPARLAFERLFVSALVRREEAEPDRYAGASRRVPGTRTARRALRAADEPLTRRSFIKGQAVNGPSGVMARLARQIGLLDGDGGIIARGHDLRAAWARATEENEEDGELGWRAVAAVAAHLAGDRWPKPKDRVWGVLADALRPDRMPAGERKVVSELLHADEPHGIRRRVLELLRDPRCLAVYGAAAPRAGSRGEVERPVLVDGLLPVLGDGPVDEHIALAVRAANAYERVSAVFSATFELMLWSLRASGGSAPPAKLLKVGPVLPSLKSWCGGLAPVEPMLRELLSAVAGRGPFEDEGVPAALSLAYEDAARATASPAALLEAVMTRHERVQGEKRKPAWVDRSASWTLMPGTPVQDGPPAAPAAGFLHPYRVVNAYSLLQDLKLVKGVRHDGEDDGE
jgi:hypothetical protein